MPPTFLEQTFGTTGPSAGPSPTWTPQQYSDWLTQFNSTPAGQAAQRARDQTAELNRKQILDRLQAERDQILVQQGRAAADKWYQEQQIKLMEDDHAFKREQLYANTAMQAATLGSQLKGPRNYPFYLEASNQVAGSGLGSTLLANQPGGLGAGRAGFTPQRQTLGAVLNDFGFGGGGNAQAGGGVTNSQLGLTDQDAQQLMSYFRSPNQAPGGWWESKSGEQKDYLRGLMEFWGESPDTFENRYGNSRVRQGNPFAATPGGYY